MIRHSVVFSLPYPPFSQPETEFLHAAERLRHIPGVARFELHRQVSPKNPFALGISMEFEDSRALERYMSDPVHSEFVQTRWIPEVTDFLEIDLEPVPNSSAPLA